MADGYDRFDNENAGGGSFVMGLLTGTVLGAGLGMLFAPKSGSELRSQISEQAGNFANTASEQYRRATEAAGEWAEKGREVGRGVYDKARDAVARGTDEAQRYVRDATGGASKSTPSAGSSTSTFGTGSAYGSESIRGSSTEGPSSRPPGGGSRRS